MVGQKFLQLIQERDFPVNELRLFASQKNAGKKLIFRNREYIIQSLKEDCFNKLQIAFFSAGETISRQWAPKAAQAGLVVIDNSSAFRMEKKVPLIVPEVNADCIKNLNPQDKGRIIANPNCSTIQLVVALHPLHLQFGLKFAHISSYQSLSGAGRAALDLLKQESQVILKNQKTGGQSPVQEDLSLPSNEKSSAFNCIPQIGDINEEGFSTEEVKLMHETKKILRLPDLKITATAVRVPTFNGHGEAVIVGLKKLAKLKEITGALEQQEGLTVLQGENLPHQRFVSNRDQVYVGRIRAVPEENGKSWIIWVAADNLRKGAALNGLQIAETLLPNFQPS